MVYKDIKYSGLFQKSPHVIFFAETNPGSPPSATGWKKSKPREKYFQKTIVTKGDLG